MIVLDTNVISEFLRPLPEPRVVEWLDSHDTAELWLTVMTVAELQAGIAKLLPGEKRDRLSQNIAATLSEFSGRILPFGEDAAFIYGDLIGPLLATKTRFAIMDYQIAAITLQHVGRLATRNTKDFATTGVALINPWTI
jgi:predicted nucleic acid-binding protein